jgi:Domain of unknown function (DUF397)
MSNESAAAGPAWVKSSLSFANNNCVEVCALPGADVGVRNSRDREGPALRFTQGEWAAFIGGARAGEFDHLAGDADAAETAAVLADPETMAAIAEGEADL